MYPNKCFLGRYNHWRTAVSRQKEMDTAVKELIVKACQDRSKETMAVGTFHQFCAVHASMKLHQIIQRA